MTSPIKVLLADDHAVVRSGLSAVLLSDDSLSLVGEAVNGEEAISLCEMCHPDVVLMDIMMPVMDGVEATRNIHEKWPDIRIIVLTSFKEKDLVQGALREGALSYLIKNVSAAELIGAIRGAMSGEPKLSPEAAQALTPETKNLSSTQ